MQISVTKVWMERSYFYQGERETLNMSVISLILMKSGLGGATPASGDQEALERLGGVSIIDRRACLS